MYSDRLSGHPRDLGYAELREHHGILRVPLEADGINVGDLVLFESGNLAGQQWVVEAVLTQSHEVTRRLRVMYQPQEVSHG